MTNIKLHQINELTITDVTAHDILVDGGKYGPIPLYDVDGDVKIGDTVHAYVLIETNDELVATMATDFPQIGECAYLKVIADDEDGTFLDWGLPQDLYLPFHEQNGRVRLGKDCFVYIYEDEDHRPAASMKIYHFLHEESSELKVGQEVDLIIASESDLGFKAVINNKYLGLIYHKETIKPLKIGAKMKGWIQDIREDGKINLNINKLSSEDRDELEQKILDKMHENNGRLNLSDKSSPELIYSMFNVSKKNFKRAIGNLYKQRLITISPKSIELISSDKKG